MSNEVYMIKMVNDALQNFIFTVWVNCVVVFLVLLRSQISRITAKTFGKIVGYNLGYSFLGSAVSGFIESWQLYRQRYTKNLQKVPVTFIV